MSPPPPFKFRLYVAGNLANSAQAAANLALFCRDYLPGRHQIEIVDVLREPKRALAEGVFLAPTLVKLSPAPICKIIGTLGETPPLLRTCGLEGRPAQ